MKNLTPLSQKTQNQPKTQPNWIELKNQQMTKFLPHLSQIKIFWQKRWGKTPLKSAKNSTKSDWTQICRVVEAQQMIKVSDEKFAPPLSQKSIFGQKGGQKTQNLPKTQPSWIELKFSG